MADPTVVARLKATIVSCLKLKLDPAEIPDDVRLVGRGLGLDSVAVLRLVGAIEDEFAIEVDDVDIGADLFRDLGTLAGYIATRMGEARVEPTSSRTFMHHDDRQAAADGPSSARSRTPRRGDRDG